MKKIAFITTNKILVESLSFAIKNIPNSEFEFFPLQNSHQAFLDMEVLEIDIALIDMINAHAMEDLSSLSFCEKLHDRFPHCNLILLVSQENSSHRKVALEAKKSRIIDDFVFYDTSLKYLLAKLSAYK